MVLSILWRLLGGTAIVATARVAATNVAEGGLDAALNGLQIGYIKNLNCRFFFLHLSSSELNSKLSKEGSTTRQIKR